jgi:putative heme iron utilization protein
MAKKDVLRETDAEARRLAQSLIRKARFGALAVLEPETGAPLASRVSLATDHAGAPVILISQLSAHFGALEQDLRCSIMLGEPGRGDPLAHPRVTVICNAVVAPRQEIRTRFLSYQPKAALYADFADFAFWRLMPERASLNGGFGKAYALTAEDLRIPVPDGWTELEAEAVAHMNCEHTEAVQLYAEQAGAQPAPWRIAGIDPDGIDLDAGSITERLWFDRRLTKPEELHPKLIALAKQARKDKG